MGRRKSRSRSRNRSRSRRRIRRARQRRHSKVNSYKIRNKPSFARNPFFNFLRDFRKLNTNLTVTEVASRGARKWNKMSEGERLKYIVVAGRHGRGKTSSKEGRHTRSKSRSKSVSKSKSKSKSRSRSSE